MLLNRLKSQILYFDGGYGTSFQAHGLKAGELPELWNISRPEIVTQLHCDYLAAGCDILKTNTFGANILKFDGKDTAPTLEEIIFAAVNNAKRAVNSFPDSNAYIALDIGPTGKLLKPLGDLDFEDAVKVFAETIKIGVKCGVDLILIETMNDCYETKAAVLAAKENCNLPIFVTNAYDESGKLMTGASPSAMVAMLEGLRVDALGINCSLGPDKMLPIISELVENSSTPIIVNPNAGLPTIRNGKAEYDIVPEKFADIMRDIANMGVSILGGCCGTTPAHIKELIKATKDLPFKPTAQKNITVVSSYTHAVEFGKKPMLIGERINPTGKPMFKTALREKNYDYILNEAVRQMEAGSDILDVNVGLPEIDETAVLTQSVKLIQSVSNLPLQIDTANPCAMEAALRFYNGKPLINSVNGKAEVMDAIFPLAAKYGGVIIALTLDDSGIPETADGRIAIAEKIIKKASEYGISSKDIIVDPLAMAISSDSSSALITLECLERFAKMGIKTSLGVSNVSFGLPQRNIITSTFFALALKSGLNAAIMNPHSKEMMDTFFAFCALSDLDCMCEKYIEYAAKIEPSITKTDTPKDVSVNDALKRAILKGLKDESASVCSKLLENTSPLSVIDDGIIPALDEIGVDFENKKAFLPQLLMSAEAAKSAFDVIKKKLTESGESRNKKCKIVLATVKGDIHDIGKNIVKVLLENYDFDVIDLGKDVAPEVIVETVKRENAPLVGLSALMTTTVPAMEETIKLLREEKVDCRTIVGGAVLTQEYADMIGADKYAKDAMETVRYADAILK